MGFPPVWQRGHWRGGSEVLEALVPNAPWLRQGHLLPDGRLQLSPQWHHSACRQPDRERKGHMCFLFKVTFRKLLPSLPRMCHLPSSSQMVASSQEEPGKHGACAVPNWSCSRRSGKQALGAASCRSCTQYLKMIRPTHHQTGVCLGLLVSSHLVCRALRVGEGLRVCYYGLFSCRARRVYK